MDPGKRKKAIIALLILCVIGFLVTSFLISNHLNWKSSKMSGAKKNAKQLVLKAVKEIDELTSALQNEVDTQASGLSDGTINEQQSAERFRKIMKRQPLVEKAGVIYSTSSQDVFHSGSYIYRIDGTIVSEPAGTVLGEEEIPWFRDSQKDSAWSEPYYNAKIKSMVVTYSAPFTVSDRRGVVEVSISLEKLRTKINLMNLGKNGYAFINDRTGTYLSHPVNEIVLGKKSIIDNLQGKEYEALRQTAEVALQGKSQMIAFQEPATKDKIWVFFEPIHTPQWIMGAVFIRVDTLLDDTIDRRQRIHIILSLIVVVTLLVIILMHAYDIRRFNLWVVSIVFAVLCMSGTVYIWSLTVSAPLREEPQDIIILDRAGLDKFVGQQISTVTTIYHEQIYFIPTGISVKNLEFTGPNNLIISGIIWQKYTDGMHDSLSRGFIMPEAKTLTVNEAFRYRQERTETVGWFFKAEIREFFDYTKYPFDRPDIWLWIKHKDIDKNVILAPDMASYKIMTPSACPGLEDELLLPGYTVLGTFFSYRDRFATSSYGIGNTSRREIFPEFYFNINVRRNFISPFMARIFPLLVILSLLFIVQLMFSKDEEDRKSFGLTGLSIMSVVISFVFSIVLTQINLRSELIPNRVVFIEYFYFITYLVLLLVAINTFLFTEKRNIWIIQYEGNLIPKLLYWPIIALMVLVITLINFY